VSAIDEEIASQPECWLDAAKLVAEIAGWLPAGERLAVVGCGTSWFIGQAWAALRERAGQGETDAFAASEMPERAYPRVLAISRSGTTTEVARALRRVGEGTPTVAITAVGDGPVVAAVASRARHRVADLRKFGPPHFRLDFADERSVVQTRFATTTLALLRALLGEDIPALAAAARQALASDLPVDPAGVEHFVFLGTGWSVGLAHEAALKLREAAGAWSESYPALEFRHGPITVPGERSLVWALGPVDGDLLEEASATGASVVAHDVDPLAELVLIQRTAVAVARARGRDPGNPRRLSRSVVLP
jgi:fructoselysine-6-P-deglycase FrlB-like protein